MSESQEERLVRIETNVAHLEHLVEQLNQVVVDQSKQLGRLQGQQQALAQTVVTQELERIKDTNAKPPHYQ